MSHQYLIELPDLKALSRDQVLAWRLALRHALQDAFARGLCAVDFIEHEGHSYYLLRPMSMYYMYVVECADGSLYTGIARDLKLRIDQHNQGRGAAYTAARRPVRLVAAWCFGGRAAAARAESEFKALSRTQKLRTIQERADWHDSPIVTP